VHQHHAAIAQPDRPTVGFKAQKPAQITIRWVFEGHDCSAYLQAGSYFLDIKPKWVTAGMKGAYSLQISPFDEIQAISMHQMRNCLLIRMKNHDSCQFKRPINQFENHVASSHL
jgi:hypothetical protein